MNLVPRAEWGAKPPKSLPMRIGTVDGVAVHWEGPPIGSSPHDDCAERVRSIQRYHQVTKGWNDIAYNFVVCPHGRTFEGRGWGVRSAANGTQLANEHYHAVCYLGGEGDPFTDAARSAIVQAVAESRRRYPAGSAVCPHSVFRPTACPGDIIRRWLASDPFKAPQEDDDVAFTPDDSARLESAKNYLAHLGDDLVPRVIELLERIADSLPPKD